MICPNCGHLRDAHHNGGCGVFDKNYCGCETTHEQLLEAELKACKAALQRLVGWYDGPDDKDELFLAIDEARLALGQELK